MTTHKHQPHRDLDIAWASGLFEGEGTIAPGNKPGELRLALNMTDEDVVRRFHEILRVGTVNGPYEGTGEGSVKKYWAWRCSTLDAISSLRLMAPYLGIRRSSRADELLGKRREFEISAASPRECPHCGAEFTPDYSPRVRRRLYCSKACKSSAGYLRRYESVS